MQEDIYFQNHVSRHNFSETQWQTIMSKRTAQADKGKGKAPAVQPHFQKPLVRISDLHEGVLIETISLQDTLSAEAMYSCGEKSVILQKVLHTNLMFQNGEFTDLSLSLCLSFRHFLSFDQQVIFVSLKMTNLCQLYRFLFR